MEGPNIHSEEQTQTPPSVAPIKESFADYSDKAVYFLGIEKEIRKREEQIIIARTQREINPTASESAYANLIATIEKEVTLLKQQKIDMQTVNTQH